MVLPNTTFSVVMRARKGIAFHAAPSRAVTPRRQDVVEFDTTEGYFKGGILWQD
jgi:hypothetical protein